MMFMNRQAIALSLQDSAEGSYLPDKNVVNTCKTEKKGSGHVQEDKGRKKNKKSVCIEFTIQIISFLVYNSLVYIGSFLYFNIWLFQHQQFASRLQLTEDELIVHFFQLDGNLIISVLATFYLFKNKQQWQEINWNSHT